MASQSPNNKAAANNKTAANVERAQMKRVLIPTLAIGAIVVLVAVFAGISDGGRKMSDGSNGGVDDPDLKTIVSGIQYRDLKEGTGEECPPDASVKVNYTGWLADGMEFDASKSHHQGPIEMDLNGEIAGRKLGIPGMKIGGIRKLVIAPEKGYRDAAKPKIPANSILIFEVELVGFTPGPRPRRAEPSDLSRLSDGTLPNAEDPNLKSLGDKGLKYRDLKVGDGPLVQPGATILADYIGWLHADNTRFDSSWTSGRSFTASLAPGPGGVIEGWQQGFVGMKVGGIRKLVIPPDLAYGAKGVDKIPPNATLVFEVEVLQTKSN